MDHRYLNDAEIAIVNSEAEDLQSQLEFLNNKVKELDARNAELSFLVAKCRCHKMEENFETDVVDRIGLVDHMKRVKLGSGDNTKKKSSKHIDGGCKTRVAYHPSKRYVALKVMYFGQRFYGFASEAQMDPTVESEIFKALKKTRLVFGNKKDWKYSRCGRTDKGVSSVGQAIALFLRSNHKEKAGSTGNSGDFVTEDLYEGELDYVRILNKVLPKDIRVIGWCPAPTDFSARFSCRSREYKYFFWKDNLNILAMEAAGKKLVGEHDFRNFCKMDAANVHNYRRHITLFEICSSSERYEGDELWSMKIKGSAFLWHQVRCMVAVLFLIGQGLESPNVLDVLLDVEKISRKPQYKMAPENPLVLQSCEFEGVKFKCSTDARQALQLHFEKECQTYKLQAAIFHEALLSCSLTENDDSVSSYGVKKKVALHVPLMSRPTEREYFLPSILQRLQLWNASYVMSINQMVEDGKYHGTFDFIFVDADKDNYINYHKRLIDLVKVGGVIGYDNTLWNGSVAAPADAPMRKYVRYYRDFVIELNKALAVDPRIEICMLPVGDGVTLCRRIS